MATDKAAGGSANQVAAAQQLVDDLHAGKISWNEYIQKWNTMKPKDVSVKVNADQLRTHYANGNIPESQYNHAIQEMSKNGSGKVTVVLNASLKSGPTSTSGSQQPPQQPTEINRPENLADDVRELLEQLKNMLQLIRNRNTELSSWSPEDRQFQTKTFHEIYKIIYKLFSKGCYVKIKDNKLVIYSPDGTAMEEIEFQVATYLDVQGQLADQQFDLDPPALDPRPRSSCPTILSAQFQEPRLVLSRQGDHDGATNVIYGIRCRLCPPPGPFEITPSNVNYVGQSKPGIHGTRSVHDRVCAEHARSVENGIDDFNEDLPVDRHRPMYAHATEHFLEEDLPQGTQPRDAFRQVMDVILLPIGPIESKEDLRSWELFWQFFFQCREFFWGWSHH